MKLLYSDVVEVCLYSRIMFENQDKCSLSPELQKTASYIIMIMSSSLLSNNVILAVSFLVLMLCLQPFVCLCEYTYFPGLYNSVHISTVYASESKSAYTWVSTTILLCRRANMCEPP